MNEKKSSRLIFVLFSVLFCKYKYYHHYYTCVAMLIFEMQLSNSLAKDGVGVGIGVDRNRLVAAVTVIGD